MGTVRKKIYDFLQTPLTNPAPLVIMRAPMQEFYPALPDPTEEELQEMYERWLDACDPYYSDQSDWDEDDRRD